MAGLNQGMQLKENLKKKVTQGFSSEEKEGFTGILGSNPAMDNLNDRDTAHTKVKTTKFNNNIAQYGTEYDALKKRTERYLNDSAKVYETKKNYNVFFNKRETQKQITGKKQKGCVSVESIKKNDIPIADGFDKAYPNNFTTFVEAENACKLWALDTGNTVYSVNKDSMGKFQCRTGTGYSTLSQYSKPSTLYTIVKGNANAAQGGLFGNGQIGTWTGQKQGSGNDPYQINALNLIPTGYEKCNRIIGGGINQQSITANYGRNCSWDNRDPVNARYVAVTSNSYGDCIQISQLVVVANNVNVALRAKIHPSTSPTLGPSRPEFVVDGWYGARSYPLIYHSTCGKDQRWIVDLGRAYPIQRIFYFNRLDCCWERANGMLLMLINETGNEVLKTFTLNSNLVQVFFV